MKVEKFDKIIIQTMRSEINEALEKVAEKYGITIKAGNASFNDTLVTFKVELTTVGENGEITDKYAESFKMYATILGLKKEDLGREFTYNGKKFILKGYNPKSRKYGFIAQNVSDKQNYKLPDDGVIAVLKA